MARHLVVLMKICVKTKERREKERRRKKKTIHVPPTFIRAISLTRSHRDLSNTTKEGRISTLVDVILAARAR
jgi:hypothetical protein